jgi:CRP-like cAMP-binding protein
MTRRRTTPLKPETIEPAMCSVHMRLEILRQVPFFANLSAGDIEQVNRLFRDLGFSPGELIYLAGDPATQLHVVASGKVKLLRHTMRGQDVLLDILTPGEFFGTLSVLGDEIFSDTAQAHTTACVLVISAADFREILHRFPSAAIAALEMVANRLKAAHDLVRQLSAHSVEQRIAAALLKLAHKLGERQPEGLLIQLPLSRQDLAEMTGTTTETASRAISQFQKEGLIHTGRQWIAITNQESLANIAAGE